MKTTFKLMKDITQYIKAHKGISYYDLKAVAFEEKNDWIPLLKAYGTRQIIRDMFNRPYNHSLCESIERATDAELHYYEEEDKKEIARLSRFEEEVENEVYDKRQQKLKNQGR